MKPGNRVVGISLGLFLLALISLYLPYPEKNLSPFPVMSLHILDHEGEILREVLSDEGGSCRWIDLSDVSPAVVQATLAAEDRYFFLHPGINPLAIVRALWQNLKHNRIISGASTITQQLARNLNRRPRNIFSKLHEAWTALRLEKKLAKREILAQYLNRVCYGNQTYGIEAASRLYFNKTAKDLSPAEAAFLAGIPRAPTLYNPYRAPKLAFKRQQDILAAMSQQGYITRAEWDRARREKINLFSAQDKFRAPHFCDFILSSLRPEQKHRKAVVLTTLRYHLQGKIEILVRNHLSSLQKKRITNAAVIVVDNDTSEIITMIGSRDFFDEQHAGQVNGTTALRQPGSTLKPFTYGLALARGKTAAEILEDRELQIQTPGGSYRPQNYDKKYHGQIRMRQALACSYNIPAVAVLQALGPDLLYQKLKQSGFKSLKKSSGFYGIGLTLGNGEVTLIELVQAYSALARGGRLVPLKSIVTTPNVTEQTNIFAPQVSYILTHMLNDNDARIPAFGANSPLNLPFDCAVKTGTSKDFRDNWTVGFTPKFTVGVWVGNFDGRPMFKVSGISGCGPLFRDIMLLLNKERSDEVFREPEGIVTRKICPSSGQLATSDCYGQIEEVFIDGTEPQENCGIHPFQPAVKQDAQLKIQFPIEGDIFKLDPILRPEYQVLPFKAYIPGTLAPDLIEWKINGKTIGNTPAPYIYYWNLSPGSYTISFTATLGKKDVSSHPVKFTVMQ